MRTLQSFMFRSFSFGQRFCFLFCLYRVLFGNILLAFNCLEVFSNIVNFFSKDDIKLILFSNISLPFWQAVSLWQWLWGRPWMQLPPRLLIFTLCLLSLKVNSFGGIRDQKIAFLVIWGINTKKLIAHRIILSRDITSNPFRYNTGDTMTMVSSALTS